MYLGETSLSQLLDESQVVATQPHQMLGQPVCWWFLRHTQTTGVDAQRWNVTAVLGTTWAQCRTVAHTGDLQRFGRTSNAAADIGPGRVTDNGDAGDGCSGAPLKQSRGRSVQERFARVSRSADDSEVSRRIDLYMQHK